MLFQGIRGKTFTEPQCFDKHNNKLGEFHSSPYRARRDEYIIEPLPLARPPPSSVTSLPFFSPIPGGFALPHHPSQPNPNADAILAPPTMNDPTGLGRGGSVGESRKKFRVQRNIPPIPLPRKPIMNLFHFLKVLQTSL